MLPPARTGDADPAPDPLLDLSADLEHDLAHDVPDVLAHPRPSPPEAVRVTTATAGDDGDYGYDLAHDIPAG